MHPSSFYIYTVFKHLRIFSFICFFSLASNLVGNLVWTYVWQKDTVELASDEEDADSDSDSDSDSNSNKSTKRSVNLLEEELHLEEMLSTSTIASSIIFLSKTEFHSKNEKPVGQDRTPLENPPENDNMFS